ncbi:MAG TPA: hypothetical protein VIW67_18920 [Terriglobales bacterium]
MKTIDSLRIVAFACAFIGVPVIRAQQQQMQHQVSETTPLSSLIEEAKSTNPQVLALTHATRPPSMYQSGQAPCRTRS